jgi:hypothetical protein
VDLQALSAAPGTLLAALEQPGMYMQAAKAEDKQMMEKLQG